MITLNYPNKPTKKERDKHFFMVRNFIDTLPCPTCRNEINNIINDNNLRNSLGSKEKFMKYFWNIHNKVNKRLNKPQLSLKKFKKLYSSQTSFSVFKLIKSNKLKNIVIVILLLIISILGSLLLKK
tara:strand:+ start:172 stop:549 length:378 start_codon:yes stop_codon:yes gene_type:complete